MCTSVFSGSRLMDSGVPGTLCPIDPGPGESFWFFKFSWAVLLLSGPNAEHRPGVQSPCTGLGVENFGGGTVGHTHLLTAGSSRAGLT